MLLQEGFEQTQEIPFVHRHSGTLSASAALIYEYSLLPALMAPSHVLSDARRDLPLFLYIQPRRCVIDCTHPSPHTDPQCWPSPRNPLVCYSQARLIPMMRGLPGFALLLVLVLGGTGAARAAKNKRGAASTMMTDRQRACCARIFASGSEHMNELPMEW